MSPNEPVSHLSPLLTTKPTLRSEYGKRAKAYHVTSVPHGHVTARVAEGWEVDKVLKTRTRLRKQKNHDELLEDMVWCLLYKLGYAELSEGRHFTVPIRRRGAQELSKQVDVLARDDETVVVVECKSRSAPGRRSLQTDIGEFASLKGSIARAVNLHYGTEPKHKIIWLLATQNIAWSNPDLQRAKGHSIHAVTEREITYFLELASHLGHAARFQFLAEFLEGQKIPALAGRSIPAIRGKLGGKKCYSFVTTPEDLLKIAFVNHRTRNDPEALPSYQRLMVRGRLRKIGKYIEKGGFFPTNILVNFKSRVRFDPVKRDDHAGVTYGHLYLPDRYKSTWIIDGQHRLYGYSGLDQKFRRENLLVVAFEHLPIEDEADLFVTINHEQKSVPRTLLDDLQGDLRWGSDVPKERIAALTARLIGQLNNDLGQPFYNRVTRQGILPTPHTCLTLPQLKMGLVRAGLLGRAILKQKHYATGPLTAETDAATVLRAREFLNHYFALLQEANPEVWTAGRERYVCTNVGVQGLLLLLASIIEHLEAKEKIVALECTPKALIAEVAPYLEPILERLREGDDRWIREHFKVKYGAGGLRQCHFRLVRTVREIAPEFEPEGFPEWLEEQSKERIEKAESQLKEITKRVHSLIFEEFRTRYGEEDYFEEGVPSKAMRVKAYDRQQDDPQRLPLEHYVQFIDLKKIVETSKHWKWFKDVLDIPERGEKGLAKNLKWLEKLNELRRIPAHPVEGRDFRMADFEYVDWIYRAFFERLRTAGNATAAPEE